MDIHRQTPCAELRDADIRRAIRRIAEAEAARPWHLSVALMDTTQVIRLNDRYLGRREDTDVLAFDLADDADSGEAAMGQIVINVERARRQAADRGIEPRSEMMLYVVHGFLHLLGYDDHAPADYSRMHSREDELLEKLGCGRVFASKSR